jgi:hypothetical protein
MTIALEIVLSITDVPIRNAAVVYTWTGNVNNPALTHSRINTCSPAVAVWENYAPSKVVARQVRSAAIIANRVVGRHGTYVPAMVAAKPAARIVANGKKQSASAATAVHSDRSRTQVNAACRGTQFVTRSAAVRMLTGAARSTAAAQRTERPTMGTAARLGGSSLLLTAAAS